MILWRRNLKRSIVRLYLHLLSGSQHELGQFRNYQNETKQELKNKALSLTVQVSHAVTVLWDLDLVFSKPKQ